MTNVLLSQADVEFFGGKNHIFDALQFPTVHTAMV